jgi:uroporphyrinogen decarboxylase
MLSDTPFLRACRREPTSVIPVWFMRQAGRYMPEYRAVREKISMLEAITTPDTAAEITLQPIDAFNLDAAIIFSDILIPLIAMGLPLDFVKGEGPHIEQPIRGADDVAKLRTPPAADSLYATLEAIRRVTRELNPRNIPLIGFAGAPFTLASYAIEGGGSKNYEKTKGMMYEQPGAWQQLMEKIVTVISDFLLEQVRAGASALQIFDSWAGALSPRDYAKFVAPYTHELIAKAKTARAPVIYFSTGTTSMLDQITALGSDVISVDWRISLDNAWQQVGYDRAIQGNLDPVALMAPWEEIQAQADEILRQADSRPGHIFNLGHGILPGTPVDNVRRLADYVHEKTMKSEQVKR